MDKMEKLYIYKLPFNGRIINTITNGIVDYTGTRKQKSTFENGVETINISFVNGLTFEQYKEKKENGKDFLIATDKEIDVLFLNYHKSLISTFSEISKEKYYEMLEVMPPLRFDTFNKNQMFFICEPYTSNLHQCFVKSNNKYYSALRKITESKESIFKSLLKK